MRIATAVTWRSLTQSTFSGDSDAKNLSNTMEPRLLHTISAERADEDENASPRTKHRRDADSVHPRSCQTRGPRLAGTYARIRRFDGAQPRQGVGGVDSREEDRPGFAIFPARLQHLVEKLRGGHVVQLLDVTQAHGAGTTVDAAQGVLLAAKVTAPRLGAARLDGAQEGVGQPDADVKVGQRAFLALAVDKLEDVGVIASVVPGQRRLKVDVGYLKVHMFAIRRQSRASARSQNVPPCRICC